MTKGIAVTVLQLAAVPDSVRIRPMYQSITPTDAKVWLQWSMPFGKWVSMS